MPRRRDDDRWWEHAAKPPRPVRGGLVSSKQRGSMATTWWSQRFVSVLESYGLGARMQRGRRYARIGQVVDLGVGSGVIAAHVQGSRPTPYVVTIALPQPTAAQWRAIDAAIAGKVGFAAHLLSGEVPPDLEAAFADAGVPLFPPTWRALKTACSCPDHENPCKHIAAVLYVFADQLDADPWLVLKWRGRSREQILESFVGTTRSTRTATASTAVDRVAPWWPFAPGPLPRFDTDIPGQSALTAHDEPDAVLSALEPLDEFVGDTQIVDLIRVAYRDVEIRE
ncbi:MAG TPA: SWIM zinc finger family protein [Acidimicrobiales bacterium]